MNEQHIKSSRQGVAITSLCFSGLSLLMVVLALTFGSSVSATLTCLHHENYPPSPLTEIVLLAPVFFPSLLAIILSFVATWRSTEGLVLSARVLSIVVFALNLLAFPFIILTTWVDGPIHCG